MFNIIFILLGCALFVIYMHRAIASKKKYAIIANLICATAWLVLSMFNTVWFAVGHML